MKDIYKIDQSRKIMSDTKGTKCGKSQDCKGKHDRTGFLQHEFICYV